MGGEDVLILGPYYRWLTELRCLKLIMKNEQNVFPAVTVD